MSGAFDPATDFTLLNLKKIAMRGGEQGPRFDRGVLFVIEQIEREGKFTPGSIGSIISLMHLQEKHQFQVLTPEELEEGRRFLASQGWTMAQAVEFANGIHFTESLLSYYKGERKK